MHLTVLCGEPSPDLKVFCVMNHLPTRQTTTVVTNGGLIEEFNVQGELKSGILPIDTRCIKGGIGLTSIGVSSCQNYKLLEKMNLENCNQLGSGCFVGCNVLTTVILPICNNIGQNSFSGCEAFRNLFLSIDGVCTLENINAFDGTLIQSGIGRIYVPSKYLNEYMADDKWKVYKNAIRGYETKQDIVRFLGDELSLGMLISENSQNLILTME